MKCPFCKTSTFRRVVAGEREIDRCTACGAFWFDYGEIRELTEGRLPPGGEDDAAPEGHGPPGKREPPGAVLSRMRAAAASLRCVRCDGSLTAADFQATGIPVYLCPGCRGILAPRASAGALAARFRFLREHGAKYAALGETLARKEKRRLESAYGPPATPSSGMQVPLPVVVPLADDAPARGSFPLATYALIGVAVALFLLRQAGGAPLTLPGGLAGLPAGTGFAGVPKLPLLFAPFFHAGILPLLAVSLFLFVLGDNVEDRMGKVAFLLLYLACGTVAGVAHVLWGKGGSPNALSSAGAVAGVLGAYLVYFPGVSIRMYGMGRIVTIPAYLFACAWVVAAFFLEWRTGPLAEFFFPAALSLAGNLAGFGAGVAGAVLWRLGEDAAGAGGR